MNDSGGEAAVYCSEGIRVLRADRLTAEGWEQRTVGDSRRISELVDMYSELGFETLTTGLDPGSFGEACTSCAEAACPTYVALFVRRAAVSPVDLPGRR
ncbi:MAG TPA: hypothetical protein ENI86_01510 [Acidimicrobiales bacterium]|nr:hypothetical protein [Acidimicrobiales bacterium]